ncbi:MAG: encapsulin-associated ferritin-like protein [Bacteroidota bacterium]
MSNYHEPAEELSKQARDFSRALNSLKEEIEAVDWYHQRVDLSENEELSEIMAHNRDEEIEHACMTLEWLRRNMPGWDEELRTYLFTEGNIAHLEEGEEGESHSSADKSDLGIGKIK